MLAVEYAPTETGADSVLTFDPHPTAIVAPRRASSSQTSERNSSVRAGRSLDVWIFVAPRPDGVRQGSLGKALHVGQRRSRQPRAQ